LFFFHRSIILKHNTSYSLAPNHFWFGLLSSLPQENQDVFHSIHFQQVLSEVGSRNMQRLLVMQMPLKSENCEQENVRMLINDWIDVQDERYRYIAIDDMGVLFIRIVIAITSPVKLLGALKNLSVSTFSN
jgi:hypothetical protein